MSDPKWNPLPTKMVLKGLLREAWDWLHDEKSRLNRLVERTTLVNPETNRVRIERDELRSLCDRIKEAIGD